MRARELGKHGRAGWVRAFDPHRCRGEGALIRLLYIEDNDDNAYMLKLRLELLDIYEVILADTGQAGVTLAKQAQPALIILDLEMAGLDGWETARRLRDDPQTCNIPIIALSAHALAGSFERALAAGCDDFATKPVEFDRLVVKIERLLTKTR